MRKNYYYRVHIENPDYPHTETVSSPIEDFFKKVFVFREKEKAQFINLEYKFESSYHCRELVIAAFMKFKNNPLLSKVGYTFSVEILGENFKSTDDFMDTYTNANLYNLIRKVHCGYFDGRTFRNIENIFSLSLVLFLMRYGIHNVKSTEIIPSIMSVKDENVPFTQLLFLSYYFYEFSDDNLTPILLSCSGPVQFVQEHFYGTYGMFVEFIKLKKDAIFYPWLEWKKVRDDIKKKNWYKSKTHMELVYDTLFEILGDENIILETPGDTEK